MELADVAGVALDLVGAGQGGFDGWIQLAERVEEPLAARALAGIARIGRAGVLGVVGMGERRHERGRPAPAALAGVAQAA